MSGDGLKVLTVVGTRPEIIRLAPTIRLLDRLAKHVLVHTGQNYDFGLNEVFFRDFRLRRPDHFLQADTSSLGALLGSVLTKMESVLLQERPDAVLVLGDTNSCISALIARRLKIPVYHMEAGNRSFDENVPEEVNRRMVDHIADYNLVYTEHARRNLLAEGIHPSRVVLTGSPMNEVLRAGETEIAASDVLKRVGLEPGRYFLASIHREENVDNPGRLTSVLRALSEAAEAYDAPVLVSTHPRTAQRLQSRHADPTDRLRFHEPFGFHDYVKLQLNAKVVLSDSGTISEESSILGFPAITLRDAIERPEAIDAGAIVTCGVRPQDVLRALRLTLELHSEGTPTRPFEYEIADTSHRVVRHIFSTAPTHHERAGIRL